MISSLQCATRSSCNPRLKWALLPTPIQVICIATAAACNDRVGVRRMTTKEILIVEDYGPTRAMLTFALSRAGFAVRQAPTAGSARAQLTERPPHLLLVDWMLPDSSGFELMRALKDDQLTRRLPVILLSPRAEEVYKVTALDSGADDYVTKPFSPRELVARIQTVLRSSDYVTAEPIGVHGLMLNPTSHRMSPRADCTRCGV